MKKYFDYFILAIKGTEKDFTTGSINRALILLSIPMVLEMAMESLFAIVDAFFISKLDSENALATIGLTESFMFIVISIAMGVSMAGTAMVARRIGEKNHEEAADSAVQTLIIATLFSIILGFVGFYYSDDLLRLMGGSPDLISEGHNYTKIILSLNIVLMFLFAINAIFRGAGDASIAMRTLWLSNGLNLILDPCLIFGLGPFPELGLTGAAIATCIGRGIGVMYQLHHLTNGSSLIHITTKNLKVIWPMIIKLLNVSIGGAGQHLLASASFIFLIRIVSQFGSEALAGYTVAWRIIMFTLLPSWGLAMAAATLVGQNLGAGLPDRAETSVWRAAIGNMAFLAFLSFCFMFSAEPLVRIFSDNPEVIRNGVLSLRIVTAGYIFYAYEMVIGQAFNGAGDTITPTVMNFVAFWIIQIPLAYYLSTSLSWGPTGVYFAIAISSSILAIIAIYVFRQGKWKTTLI